MLDLVNLKFCLVKYLGVTDSVWYPNLIQWFIVKLWLLSVCLTSFYLPSLPWYFTALTGCRSKELATQMAILKAEVLKSFNRNGG